MKEKSPSGYRVLLTGGSGFLGTALRRELLDQTPPFPLKSLRILDLETGGEHPSDPRVEWIRGDVRDPVAVAGACREMDVVLHAAAIVDWGTRSEEEIMAVNLEGTRNVVRACTECGVKVMVYTSSLDVLFSGKPLRDVDETTPFPEKHGSSYCVSKTLAEKLVLGSNGNGLRTCSLRPADIYGEGDPYHIGSLIQMARKGFYVRLGNGKSRCQHAYVGNVAHAHVLAAAALLDGNGTIAGRAYFITDGPPSNFFTFFDAFVEAAGYSIRPRNAWLPRWFAYALGCISESVAFLLRPVHRYAPKMSRFAVTYTCTDYTFRPDRAEKELGFRPRYSRQEAFDRTVAYFRRNP
jgi:nucleoside-diphosphate-sugar epimerase